MLLYVLYSFCLTFLSESVLLLQLQMQILVKTVTGRTITVEVESTEQIEYVKVCVEPPMCVFVKTNDGKILTLEPEKTHTISNLKGMIEKMEGIPQSEQQLFFGEKKLENESTLASCGVVRESTINLVLNSIERMKIWVDPTNLTVGSISLNVDGSYLIEDVKARIRERIGTPPWQQKLLFCGKLLKNRHTLAEYNVKDGSKINLVDMRYNSL